MSTYNLSFFAECMMNNVVCSFYDVITRRQHSFDVPHMQLSVSSIVYTCYNYSEYFFKLVLTITEFIKIWCAYVISITVYFHLIIVSELVYQI